MNAPLYNARILRLAAFIPLHARLENPQATVRRTSPVCGSRVIVDVGLNAQGEIREFGQEVRACALGQASASILAAHIIGQTAQSLETAHSSLQEWLKGEGALPDNLAQAFPDLEVFEPARAHPARHASILLAFEAAAAAALEASQNQTQTHA